MADSLCRFLLNSLMVIRALCPLTIRLPLAVSVLRFTSCKLFCRIIALSSAIKQVRRSRVLLMPTR